jgi:hypothetical protein
VQQKLELKIIESKAASALRKWMMRPSPITEMWVELIDLENSMNKDIVVTWKLPTERAPGIPLTPEEIDFVQIQHKVGTAPFVVSGEVRDMTVTSFRIKNRPPGNYTVRGIFKTKDEQVSPASQGTITIEEPAPEPVPVENPLENFMLSLEDPA